MTFEELKPNCVICGKGKWRKEKSLYSMIQTNMSELTVNRNQVVVFQIFSCLNCGYTVFINSNNM